MHLPRKNQILIYNVVYYYIEMFIISFSLKRYVAVSKVQYAVHVSMLIKKFEN